MIPGERTLVKIYLTDADKFGHEYVWRLLLDRAHEAGLAGCTIFRGIAGFGRARQIHTEIALEGSAECLPILFECVDADGKIEKFLKSCDEILTSCRAFLSKETLMVRQYQSEADSLGGPETWKADRIAGENSLLRIFIGESDKEGQKSLYLVILEVAKKMGLAGCTVIRGAAGFGASSIIHNSEPLRLSSDAPILVEAVDTPERIGHFLQQIRSSLKGALVTEEKVTVHHYGHQ